MGLEHLLEEFYHAKDRLKELEDIVNEYKDKIEDEMDKERLEYLETDNYYVERRKMSSETLKKSDCPKEIWNEYATRHSYTGLYIKKKGEKRRSRSPRRRSRSSSRR